MRIVSGQIDARSLFDICSFYAVQIWP